ncbi:MAG: cellulase family glycosylhydrolase [Sphingomicrobium sp.]
MRIVAAFALCLSSAAAAQSAPKSPTMQVVGRHLYTAAGERVILRGFNEMFGFSKNPRGTGIIGEIAKTGANGLRIVTTANSKPDDIDAAVASSIAHGMIPMIECHSATGKWEKLGDCVNYWLQPELVALARKHERWLLLNIANEAGNIVSRKDFVGGYSSAIQRLRAVGIRVPLIIDGTKWGQEYDILLDEADTFTAADPLRNVMVSAHAYWIGSEEERKAHYRTIIRRVTAEKIPFVMAEGPQPAGFNCTASPYQWAMTELNKAEIGWITWSWGMMPNGDCKDNSAFDVTRDGKFGNWKTEFGRQVAFAHPASVGRTSRRPCSIPNAGRNCVRSSLRRN